MIDDEPVPNFLKTWVITGEVSKSRQAQIADEFRRFSLPGALILDRAGQGGFEPSGSRHRVSVRYPMDTQ